MAYRTARRAPARAARSRRSYGAYGAGGRARAPARGARRVSRRSAGVARQQTLKLVIETVPASNIARPEGAPLQVPAKPPAKSKF